ncbi:MAG: hypothetical protein Q8M03_10140, partial [Legionella sp.]|nr:hypothetical protein [Legionella sp.]
MFIFRLVHPTDEGFPAAIGETGSDHDGCCLPKKGVCLETEAACAEIQGGPVTDPLVGAGGI